MLSRTAAKLGCRWYDMYYLERSLNRALPEFDADVPLEYFPATAADQREILSKRNPRFHRQLKRRFASDGIDCFVARSAGRLAAHSMLRSGLMDITGLDGQEIAIRKMPMPGTSWASSPISKARTILRSR